MKITIEHIYSHKETLIVYAAVFVNDSVYLSASLDYCISWCKREGHEISNAHEVLVWLHENAQWAGK